MAEIQTAKRYSKALFDLAAEQDQLDLIREDLANVEKFLKESVDLSRFLQDPLLPQEKKKSIFEMLFKDKIDALTLRFILFLIEKNRSGIISQCCIAFESLYFDFKGILQVKILAAKNLTKDQLASIKTKLKEKLNKEIETDLLLDSKLLGGFKIIIGDQVFDFSLKTQLLKIKQNIIYGRT